ncbi:hypothetical protein EYF80_010690 [Liparis tanakae]|uniref:Uncharacterized protein n=1 Tax=Liparis tanakae TaxID=230148 RepID=A0A4Z2IMJ7_9TELE|nr:hypothetical protein EYF80_010690 [Liparis tanakae]
MLATGEKFQRSRATGGSPRPDAAHRSAPCWRQCANAAFSTAPRIANAGAASAAGGAAAAIAAASDALAISAALVSISSIRRCTIFGISCTRWLERISFPAQLSTHLSWTDGSNDKADDSNSLHLPLITSLVPHYLHLVLTPFSPVAHSLVSP